MRQIVRQLDAWQRRWKAISFLWAVQKKFGDDRGSYLCALITYFGFLSVFPLVLAAFTVVAYVLSGDHGASVALEHHIGQYPIIGPAAKELEGKSLKGSPLALIAGVLGLVWGAQGLAQAVQFASAEIWNVPRDGRPGFVRRLASGLGWYAVFGTGVVVATFVSSLGSVLHWPGGPLLSTLLVVVFDVLLFVACFGMISPPGFRWPHHLPGAVVAGTLWAVLTGVGVGLAHRLAHTNSLYGTFAPVLGLLAFVYLMARISVLAEEANVVRASRLYPRSLGGENPTEADRIQLDQLRRREERT